MAPQPQKSAEQQKRERADAKDKRIRELERELAEEKRQHHLSLLAQGRAARKLYQAEAAIRALSALVAQSEHGADLDDLIPF